jgi:hypothetical protein
MTTITLYQPVGLEEIQAIKASEWTALPPHDIEQPIFRPVTSEVLAAKLARDWNAAHTTYRRGYVVRFEVLKGFLDAYETKVSGILDPVRGSSAAERGHSGPDRCRRHLRG